MDLNQPQSYKMNHFDLRRKKKKAFNTLKKNSTGTENIFQLWKVN